VFVLLPASLAFQSPFCCYYYSNGAFWASFSAALICTAAEAGYWFLLLRFHVTEADPCTQPGCATIHQLFHQPTIQIVYKAPRRRI